MTDWEQAYLLAVVLLLRNPGVVEEAKQSGKRYIYLEWENETEGGKKSKSIPMEAFLMVCDTVKRWKVDYKFTDEPTPEDWAAIGYVAGEA
jgi:hypothetical protein